MTKNNRQCALITGGSNGIGYEFAKLFAEDGYDLVLVARTEADLKRVAGELQENYKINVTTIAKDLFDLNAPKEIYEELRIKGQQIDILVNDAGQGEYGFFHETDIQRDIDIINLNVIAPVYLTKLFLKDMIARNEGRILNVASLVSKNPSPLLSIYSATKAFVYSWTQSLRNELKDTNITVTALLPGATETDFFNKAGMLNTKEYQKNPHSDPKDVAKDGYDALMEGDDKIVSGLMNKIMAYMGNLTPDTMLADNMRKNHMKNVDGTEGKEGGTQGESSSGVGMRQAASMPSSSGKQPNERYIDPRQTDGGEGPGGSDRGL
jgi:short-subunit dehydrogenase